MFETSICFDIGTDNLYMFSDSDNRVRSSSNCIAYDVFNNSIYSIGSDAAKMLGKTPDSLELIYPIEKSKVFNYEAMFDIISYYIQFYCKNKIFKPAIFLSNTSDNNYDKKILKDLGLSAGASKVGLINSSASAKVELKEKLGFYGAAIVDFGAGTTKIYVNNTSSATNCKVIPVGSSMLNFKIQEYYKDRNYIISFDDAEKLKTSIGNALPIDVEIATRVYALNTLTKQYESLEVSSSDIYFATQEIINYLCGEINTFISSLNIEYVYELSQKGISFCGGGCLLNGFQKLLESKLNYVTHFNKSPEYVIINGMRRIIMNNKYSGIIEYL